MDWARRNAPTVLLGVALACSGALTIVLTSEMTFFQDTWEVLMNRRGVTVDSLLEPHNEHIVVIQVAIEQLFLRLFGMSTARPEYILLTIGLLVSALLVFIYARRRVGPWLALFAAVLLLFLGPAWEVLLWSFEIGFVGSVLFGVAMLLMLESEGRPRDALACLFLALSMGFSSLGLAFAAAAVVHIFQRRRDLGLSRVYVVAVPVALYALWYLGWGKHAETHLSLHNVLASPRFVSESMAAAVGSMFGLGVSVIGGFTADRAWGVAVLVALIAVLAYQQGRRSTFPSGLWPVAAAAATSWFLTAFNQIPGRDPFSSRYQYAGVVFVILILANLLQGVRFGRRGLIALGAVTAAAVGSNLIVLKDGKDWLQDQTVYTRADLGAIEIAHRTVDPSFDLSPEVAGTSSLIDITAGEYLAAEEEYGSPAYTPAELVDAPAFARRQADIILSYALPLTVRTVPGSPPGLRRDCVSIPGGRGGLPAIRISPGKTRIDLAPGPEARLSLRRFASNGYPVRTEGSPGGSATFLEVPSDAAPQAWRLRVDAEQKATVCAIPSASRG